MMHPVRILLVDDEMAIQRTLGPLLRTHGPATLWWLAALASVAGAFVERWLFFAEAKHLVTLYY